MRKKGIMLKLKKVNLDFKGRARVHLVCFDKTIRRCFFCKENIEMLEIRKGKLTKNFI